MKINFHVFYFFQPLHTTLSAFSRSLMSENFNYAIKLEYYRIKVWFTRDYIERKNRL